MNKNIVFHIFVTAFALIAISACTGQKAEQNVSKNTTQINPVTNITMKIESPAFNNNGLYPFRYTCDGEDISPPLKISAVPAAAKSLVLIVDDPDASSGDFVHWTVFNIDPATAEISEGKVAPGATEGITDFGSSGYGGPCPPSGVHHYRFTLYALDTILTLPQSSKKQDIEKAMNAHVLDQSLLVGLYQRK
jgi:Raf kinase inhibitor-like YbhB/YbcL family protein